MVSGRKVVGTNKRDRVVVTVHGSLHPTGVFNLVFQNQDKGRNAKLVRVRCRCEAVKMLNAQGFTVFEGVDGFLNMNRMGKVKG
jgi:hypothetical protein